MIHDVEQKSPEWFELRKLYPLTASNAQAIATGGKGLETLIWEKLAEKNSTAERENYTNEDIERGNALESHGKGVYSLENSKVVSECGFVTNPLYELCGASPDGLVDDDGLIEIKCFNDRKHFMLIYEQKKTGTFEIESQYRWQMQMQLLITERKWVDYVVFNPNFKESLLVQRVEPDQEAFEKLKKGIEIGIKKINEIEEII